jgi:hypothetical protein
LIFDLLFEKIKHILSKPRIMIEIKSAGNEIFLKTSENVNITLNTETNSVEMEGFDVTYP